MAFSSAQKARMILGDFALSAFLQKIESTGTIPMMDATTLISTGEECLPGVKSSKTALTGLLDSDGAATGQNQQLFSQLAATTDDAVSVAYVGFALGNPTVSTLAVEDSYTIHDDVKAVVGWDLGFAADGPLDFGVSLEDLVSITSTTTGTAVDNAASTANGGAGYVHCTAFASFTNVVVKIQHSTDNSSWADLATFTTITAKTSQRVTVAAGTTVNRYVRALLTVSGSGSATIAVAFARR